MKKIVSCIFLLILTTNFSFSQQKSSTTTDKHVITDVEKIYLHTDRPYYVKGESIWYKAYTVYAYNNLLFDHSNVLYVELISPESKILMRNKIRLEEGLGYGDIALTDSIGVKKSGVYQLRAYTNWNRNFGDDFVFKKEIEILDVFEKNKASKSEGASQATETKNLHQVNKEKPNLQFFPEGGSLLENVISVVAFKAVSANGEPINVRGKVFNSKNELVTLLGSVHDGMGKFHIKPEKGEKYYAKITNLDHEEILKLALPEAKKQGYLLSFRNVQGKDMVTIKTNNATLLNNPNAPVKIIGTTRAIGYFETAQSINETNVSFELPKKDFPNGIAQITLYDKASRPQSERLVYVEKTPEVNIALSTEKNVYKPKEEVTVNISSKTKAGEVVPASFSISSIDMNGLEDTKDMSSNICSYFLMESDIRGQVINPGYYFDGSNPRRLANLDLLLLTQGWRDFLWKEIPEVKGYRLPFKAEKGITISGRVKEQNGNIAKPNNKVLLSLFNNKQVNTLYNMTDSIGRFKFENLVFMGQSTMMLNTQSESRKNRGMFVLDSLFPEPMAVKFKKDSTVYLAKNKDVKEHIFKKNIAFGITGSTLLDEVEIVAKKKSNVPESIYGEADHSYIVDERTQRFSSIYQLIQFSIPGVMVSGTTIKFTRNTGAAQILVDGAPWESDALGTLLPDDVAKIESMNGASAAVFGSSGANGAILIYTKEGALNRRKNKHTPHSITKKIDGFYKARVFYSPNPNEPTFEMDNSAAVRNTLYWNPFIHPDGSGNAKVSYFNSEVETTVKVTLEGITATGIPVVVKTDYVIGK
ncbi:TonB-dependent receptor plug domain-containing protein [Tamlana agarivorans]|uniref:TonB-dependent receptor plug domain-containing protein n=1 Tax=Pseudotamlana agarivorans TaxID=481183 RepID=A0ACC5U5P9_9FLAO|nr:TonB-dependent receptor plug domain-containing protein [Tamlana agarivorans]MBU2949644.1 TonB-dependent receptor plug domain-containing protein [Tamlana agarivorans]